MHDPEQLVVTGVGRDLVTNAHGAVAVVGTSTVAAEFEGFPAYILTAIETTPSDDRQTALVGSTGLGGFRRRLDEAMPDQLNERTLRHLLLDDLPGALIVSGHAVSAGRWPVEIPLHQYRPPVDQCAGFVSGGTLMNSFDDGAPVVLVGPAAGDLGSSSDEHSWHALAELPVRGVRRRRRIDAWFDEQGRTLWVDAMFRDAYGREDEVETVVHEYELEASVDVASGTVLSCVARPRVLPWRECPAAAASAQRIVGTALTEVNAQVRGELRGISTCTHLNDLLRSISDAEALGSILRDCG